MLKIWLVAGGTAPFLGMQQRDVRVSNQEKLVVTTFYLLPFQNGYINLVNWDVQRQLWDYVFGNDILKIRPQDLNLVLTEPVFNFPSIQDTLSEIFFEEYRFKSLLCTTAPTLSALNYSESHSDSLCCVVVDTGYSFTHIVPYYRGKVVPKGILRIDVGGKLLTNHLKEIVSYRQLHVLDERRRVLCFTGFLQRHGDGKKARDG